MDNILVSIIIPTYKNRGQLKRCINSALEQTYKNVEVIVVDDNEPATPERYATELVLSQYDGNKKVSYIKHDHNKNGSAARNTGWKASHGQYIAFLDDDDMFYPEKVEKELSFLLEHPEYDAAYTFEEYEGGKRVSITPYEGDVSKQLLLLDSHIQTSTVMFRRYALEKIDGFDESFRRHQDLEVFLRFFQVGMKVGCLQECLTVFGKNMGENAMEGGKMEDLKKQFLSQFGDFIDKYEKEEPGFKNKVYAKHYAAVFLKYVKAKDIVNAVRIFCKYFPKSPKRFYSVVNYSLKAHL